MSAMRYRYFQVEVYVDGKIDYRSAWLSLKSATELMEIFATDYPGTDNFKVVIVPHTLDHPNNINPDEEPYIWDADPEDEDEDGLKWINIEDYPWKNKS